MKLFSLLLIENNTNSKINYLELLFIIIFYF